MFFPRRLTGPRHVVVDIGSCSVKVAAVASGNSGPVVSRATTIAIPEGCMRNGAIIDTTAVAEAIGAFARAERFQGLTAVTAVPGRRAMLKLFELPIDGKDLDTAVEFEAMQRIPENLSNVCLDYQAFSPAGGEEKRTVLLTAAKKELVRSYMDVLSNAGFAPAVVDVDYCALHNLRAHLYPETRDQSVCLVHAGESITTVTLSRGQSLFLSSELDIAGRHFTETLAGELEISIEAAEVMKRHNGPEGASSGLEGSIHTLCFRFADELDRALGRLAATSGHRTIDRLFLSGGTSKLTGLHETAGGRLRHRVSCVEPLLGGSQTAAGALNELPPDFAVVGGLALRCS